MSIELYRSIVVKAKSIGYYLPNIESGVSKEVADEIRKNLHDIEQLAKMLVESEREVLKYATGEFPAVTSSSQPESGGD